jgi:type IV secretion system protein TrbL
MMKKNAALFTAALLLLISQSSVANQSVGDVGQIIAVYRDVATEFRTIIIDAALYLIVTLAVISLIWSALKMLFKEADFFQIAIFLLASTVTWGLQWQLIKSDWLALGIEGFIWIGQKSTGMSGLQPSDVLWQGFDLVLLMLKIYSNDDWLSIIEHPLVSLVLAFCVIAVLAAFIVLMAQIAITFAQMYFYLAVAPLLIAFGVLGQTRDIAAKAISAVISYGLRFLAIYFVVFVAQRTVPLITDLLTASKMGAADDFAVYMPLLAAVAMAALIAWLALKGPAFADSVLQGVSSLSASDALGPGSSAAAGAIAGAVAGGMVSGFQKIIQMMPDGPMKSALDSAAALRDATDLGKYAGMGSMGAAMNGVGVGGNSDASGSNSGAPDMRPSWMKKPDPAANTSSSAPDNFAGAKTAQGSSDGGQAGSIGGAGSDQSASRVRAAVAEHVRTGLQEFTQAEKSPGAAVNISLHNDYEF